MACLMMEPTDLLPSASLILSSRFFMAGSSRTLVGGWRFIHYMVLPGTTRRQAHEKKKGSRKLKLPRRFYLRAALSFCGVFHSRCKRIVRFRTSPDFKEITPSFPRQLLPP